MAIVWRVEAVGTDSYRFVNFTGRPAADIRIDNDQPGSPVEIAGPVDFAIGTISFDQRLDPGNYNISWHPMFGEPDQRQSATFTLPPSAGTLLVELS